MSLGINASELVGRNVVDESGKDIGKVISFVIDSSGQPQEILIETLNGHIIKHEANLLREDKDRVVLISEVDKKVKTLMEQLPIIRKKRKILDKLVESKVISSGIYENLCEEFDKTLKEMENEAQTILEDIDKQIKVQDEQLRTLQLARAFLEIEHGIDTIDDEKYQQSIMSVLKQVKNTQQTKLSLLKTKERVEQALQEVNEKEEDSGAPEEKGSLPEVPVETSNESVESKEERRTLTVRVTEG
ncbi:MAG: PRC-barrel domain-containing protein [Candidatus Bathyarchaeia archaeon]